MANDLNQCNFIGRLGADPDVRSLPDGNAVCNIRIAVGKSYTNKTSGEKVEDTQWIPVVMFRALAEISGKYLTKGKQVFISGEWKTREWQDKDGNRRWTTEIIAHSMQMLGGKSDQARPAPTERPPFQPNSSPEDDDSIPF